MPGLVRGVVRTAAVAGTATAVSGRVQRRQAMRWQDQEMQQAPQAPAAAPAGGSNIEQLKQLGELHQSGVLTDEEFAAEKAKLL